MRRPRGGTRSASAVLDIAECIPDLARRYDVREVALDPWRAAALEREGLTVSTYPQQDARVIPASQRLHEAIIAGRVEIEGVTALMMVVDRLENQPKPVELLGWL